MLKLFSPSPENPRELLLKLPLTLTLVYAGVSALWILFSDFLLLLFFSSPSALAAVQVLKGWLFVLLTAALLYGLTRRAMDALLAAQETLKASEEKYRLLFHNSSDAVVVLNSAGCCVEANPQAGLLTGYEAAELLGRHFTDLATEISAIQARRYQKKIVRSQRQQGEARLRRRDGQMILVEYIVTPSPAPFLQVVLWDVTNQRETQRELQRQALIFKNLTDAIIVTDMERRVLDWNPAAERMFGYSRKNGSGPAGAPARWPAQSAVLEETITQALQAGGSWSGQISFVRPDDQAGLCETIIVPLCSEPGVPIAHIAINRDVTETRQLADQLQQAQKMEAVGRLAGGIAHDFNNLLTVINGYSELSLSCFAPDNPVYRDLTNIHEAGLRAAELTRRLLAFSRQQVLQPQVLDLNAVIRDIEKILRRLIGEDIELSARLADDLRWVRVDPVQLEQVVLNLAVNARDAMPGGGRLSLETANVSIGEADRQRAGLPPGAYILLTVSDTGHGMDPETQARIFEPFFTTKDRDRGTGLGLAMVYGIVTQSGGHIRVMSRPGWGTVFSIYLPALDQPELVAGTAPALPVGPAAGETILLVEDEEGVRDLLGTILSDNGYTVLTAGQPGEAVRLCRDYPGPIDLLLTDMVMPGQNGFVLSEQLAQLKPGLKIVLMSGYSDHSLLDGSLPDAVDLFIQKPFGPDILLRRLREVLD